MINSTLVGDATLLWEVLKNWQVSEHDLLISYLSKFSERALDSDLAIFITHTIHRLKRQLIYQATEVEFSAVVFLDQGGNARFVKCLVLLRLFVT